MNKYTCWTMTLVLAAGPLLAESPVSPAAELHIGRVMYASGDGARMWRPFWAIDYPDAEYHLTRGLRRLTSVDVAGDSIHVSLTDEVLFDHPWLFIQQIGRSSFSDAELDRLREYVHRGGFVLIDDFHGDLDWLVMTRFLQQAFPEWPVQRLPEEHALMNVFFALDQNTQIPGRRHLYRAADGTIQAQLRGPAQWHGIYDDAGRLVVAINFNMDMGDAWEHADDPLYPLPMTALAYRFAVNYVVYAMTH